MPRITSSKALRTENDLKQPWQDDWTAGTLHGEGQWCHPQAEQPAAVVLWVRGIALHGLPAGCQAEVLHTESQDVLKSPL